MHAALTGILGVDAFQENKITSDRQQKSAKGAFLNNSLYD
jgi:hypothetical protein